MSSIFAAAHRDDLGSFEYLLNKLGAGSDGLVTILDHSGRSLLHFASEGSIKVLTRLIELNSSLEFVNLVDNCGRTALDYAVASKKSEAEVVLRKNGAIHGNPNNTAIKASQQLDNEDLSPATTEHVTPQKESSFWANLPVNRFGDGATENDFGDISTLPPHLGAHIPAPASLKWCDFSTEDLRKARFSQLYENLGAGLENSHRSQGPVSILDMMSFSTCYTEEACRQMMLPETGSVEWIGLEEEATGALIGFVAARSISLICFGSTDPVHFIEAFNLWVHVKYRDRRLAPMLIFKAIHTSVARFGIQRAIFTTQNALPLRPVVSLRTLERPLDVPLLVSRGLLRIQHGEVTITDLVNRYTPPEIDSQTTCERIGPGDVDFCRSFGRDSIRATRCRLAPAFPTNESFSEQFGDPSGTTLGYIVRDSDSVCGVFALRRLLGVQPGRPTLTVASLTYCMGSKVDKLVPWIIRMAISDLGAALVTTLDQGPVRRHLGTIGGFQLTQSEPLKYHFFNYRAPTLSQDEVQLFMV